MDLRKPQLALWKLEAEIAAAAADYNKTGKPLRGAAIAASLAAVLAAAPAFAAKHEVEALEARAIAGDLAEPAQLSRLAEIVSTVHASIERALPAEARLLKRRANGTPKEKPPAFLRSVKSLLGVG